MLTTVEKILFVLVAVGALALSYRGFRQMYLIINRGEGKLYLDGFVKRAINALVVFLTQTTVLKRRPLVSILHVGVAWGFTFYFLVNLIDVLEGYFESVPLFEDGFIAGGYKLVADVLSVAVLVGVV
jgi:hypothetical protein